MNKNQQTLVSTLIFILLLGIVICFALQFIYPEKFNTSEMYSGLTSLNIAQLCIFLCIDAIMITDVIFIHVKKVEVVQYSGTL